MTFPTPQPALARALASRGYTVPTAVQLAVLDGQAADRDLLVSAQTGSGKTVAFGLAMGATLLGDAEQFEAATAPLALVIAPTRELAMQVSRELTWLFAATGARVTTCVGGMDARAEARQLHAGAHIVVGTPGRLRDHLERRRLDLSQLRVAVLDEADEMLDLGFREDLEFILDATPAERRTLLFSATLPPQIESLAGRYQRDAQRIATVHRNEAHADIDYRAHRVSPKDVENAVVNVLRLHEARAALVFCATREAVNRMNARLIERGFSAVALSGELTQNERTRALQVLRDGRARVLVATDVAARGLDLPDLALVIHADLPNDRETLLHRSGRTGRAGRKGLCVLIVPFNRRRKAETLIGAARLNVTWMPVPTPDEIRVRDQERLLADASFTAPASEEELRLARALQAARPAEEIALALIRLHGANQPAPEDLLPDEGPPRREWRARDAGSREGGSYESRPPEGRFEARAERGRGEANGHAPGAKPRYQRAEGAADGPAHDGYRQRPDGGQRPPQRRRGDDRDMVWFRLNIGRERNADPRWLVPLICRAGGVTKAEIGVIRIEEHDTRFQIAAEHADQFAHAAKTAKNKEGQIVRVDGDGTGGGAGASAPTPKEVAPTPKEVAPPPMEAAPPAKETRAPLAAPDAAADGLAKKRDKGRWRDTGKSHAGERASRPRNEKPSFGKKRTFAAGGPGEAGARAASKFGKRKHRAGTTSKP